jgi:regulator of sigma E protease
VLTLLATLVLLSVLILIHEIGHYIAAKSVDVEVQRFSLGMGPKVAGVRIGETEFVLSALPIGGYVSMAGMHDDEAAAALEGGGAERRESSSRDFDAKPLWARIWVVSAGVLMNFLFAVLVFAAIPYIWGEQVDLTRQITIRHAEQLPPQAAPLAQVPLGAELVAINDRQVNSWNEITRALMEAGSGMITLRFADAEPLVFQMPTPDSLRVAVITSIRPHHPPIISEVMPGEPGAEAGLLPGDQIFRAAGVETQTWWHLEEAIRAHPGQPLRLEVQRNDQRLELVATPAVRPDRVGRGEPIGYLGIGVARPTEVRSYAAGEALVRGARDTWHFSTMILGFLGNLITGHESPRQVGSVLTIGQISGEFARAGLEPFLYWMAIFSINLAVLNLLPIPILDGGHLMFMLIEALRGRPLSLEQRVRLSHVGLIIVVGIMVWALTNDVLRVIGV